MADDDQELLHEAMRETETEILDSAFQDEPVKEQTEKTEPEPKAEAKADTPHDETGKFKAKEEAKEKPVEAKTEPEKSETVEDDKANVPSWRLREVADEKRALQAERDKLNTELAQMRVRMSALEKPVEQPKQEDIDPLLDPQGFAKKLQSSFEQRLSEERLNNNLAIAHVKHGEKFEKAYNALLSAAQSGNRQIVPQLTSQPNPGEAIVRWYSEQETLREVGNDPASYKQKLLDEALKDPTYLAKAIEAAKASAGQSNGQNNITRLPPSLSRTAGSSSHDADDGDDSDAAIFAYATK